MGSGAASVETIVTDEAAAIDEAVLPAAVRAVLDGYRAEVERLNRRAFMRELHRTIAYCERYDATASLVFFDLDGFKTVNDQYGHAAGDAALQWVAATLADHVRESDVVGRLGGDEFAVILAQAPREAAQAKAASLAAAIHDTPVVHQGRSFDVRTSYGVRCFEKGVDAASLLAEADAAMFLRKGRR